MFGICLKGYKNHNRFENHHHNRSNMPRGLAFTNYYSKQSGLLCVQSQIACVVNLFKRNKKIQWHLHWGLCAI